MNTLHMLEVRFEFGGEEQAIYPVLLKDNSDSVLIDCGYHNFLPLLQAAALEKGQDLSQVTKLIITHHDFDHMGSLGEIKRVYPHIEVLSSVEDMPHISGQEKSLRLQQAEAIFELLPEEAKPGALQFQQLLEAVETVPVDKPLHDQDCLDCCGGVEIIATPGHMPGHISVYARAFKTLIAGDALVIENGCLTIANPQYTLDMDAAKRSIEKLLRYDIEQVICYHGGVFSGDVKAALTTLLAE